MKKLTLKEILKLIPQRYPFLMIDRAVIMEKGKKAVGGKAVSGNEGFIQGHFPGNPIMPGVLIVEAMGQTAAVLLGDVYKDKLGMFVGLDKVKFRKTVVPGDLLLLNVELLGVRHKIGKVHGIATVDGERVAEADFKFTMVDLDVK